MRLGLQGWRAAALACATAAGWCGSGCATVKVTHAPPPQAHQPQTDLPAATKAALRDASRGGEEPLGLAAIKTAEPAPASAAAVAAYAAELRPASADFIRLTMMAMFPDRAAEIAVAVAAALPTSQSLAPPPRGTGHTFFDWP